MNRTYLSEIIDGREAVSFPLNASLRDLIRAMRENWRIHNFYFTDGEKRLRGIVKKSRLLEYLAPLYCAIDRSEGPELEDRLALVKAESLFASEVPCLTAGHTLPEALIYFVEEDAEYLPLIDNRGRLVGEVSADTLIKSLPAATREHRYAV